MRFIGQFISLLWDASRRGNRVNYGRGPAVLYTFLFLVFMVVGLILVALDFDLQKVDVWLNAHNNWFLAIGDVLWRMTLVVVVALCASALFTIVQEWNPARPSNIVVPSSKHPLPPEKPPRSLLSKLGGILLCLTIGYFALIGVFWVN